MKIPSDCSVGIVIAVGDDAYIVQRALWRYVALQHDIFALRQMRYKASPCDMI